MSLMPLLIIALIIAALIAWILSITLFIDAIKLKGHFTSKGTGILWFVGLFATPIVIGLYAAALPDKGGTKTKPREDELPEI